MRLTRYRSRVPCDRCASAGLPCLGFREIGYPSWSIRTRPIRDNTGRVQAIARVISQQRGILAASIAVVITRPTHGRCTTQVKFIPASGIGHDTPEWRVARSVRSPGRLGGKDRAFNVFPGPSTYSGLASMNRFPRLSRANPPVNESELQVRSSPTMCGSTCPFTAQR